MNEDFEALAKQIQGKNSEEITEKMSNVESSDRSVTGDISDRSVTGDISPHISLLTYISDPDHLFSGNLFNKTLHHFYKSNNEPVFLSKMAEMMGEDKGSLRVAISRHQEFFLDKSDRGVAGLIELSEAGIREINSRVAEFEKKTKALMLQKNTAKEAVSRDASLFNSAKGFFEANKNKILREWRKENTILINFMDIAEFDVKLSEEILTNPEETLRKFELAFEEIGILSNIRIRLFGLPKDSCLSIEGIRAIDLNSLISVSGRAVTTSDVRPQVVNAKFECPSCGATISVLQVEKKFREPVRCSCGRRGGFKLISEEVIDTGRLILEDLQEKTDNPHVKRLNCFLKEDLLSSNMMRLYDPGKELQITGILKKVPVPDKLGGISTRFEIALEVLSVVPSQEEISTNSLTPEDLEKIKELSKDVDEKGLSVITESFAPAIHGHETIKEAIVLQLASKKNDVDKKQLNKPNILLIGDPGTSKTLLGEFAVSITPGSRKAVGGSSSGVGLTGSVVRDDFTGGWRLEPGAIVLARDIILVDEINNQQDEDKPKLQEALSEHTITIDKASVHMKLKAQASVLATANPIHGLFKDDEDLVQQFNISPAIINRFDLIFVVRDVVNKATDELIAKRMNEREMGKINCKYDGEFLKKFFVYVKELPNPTIHPEINKRMAKIYSKLRTFKTSSLNINPRVHSAFLQLCKASAKIRLSDSVGEKDIERALDILSHSYFQTPVYKMFKDFLGESKEEEPSPEDAPDFLPHIPIIKIYSEKDGKEHETKL